MSPYCPSESIPFLPPCRGKARMGVEFVGKIEFLPPPYPSPCKGEGMLCFLGYFV